MPPDPAIARLRLSRRQATAAMLGSMLGGLAGSLGGCGPVRAPRVALGGRGKTDLTPGLSRLDILPGRPILFPVQVGGALPGSFRPRLALADGRELDASLVWIGIQPDEAAATGWLPAPGRWVVTPVHEGAIPASIGSWHVVADAPADAGGQAVRLGDKTVRTNWLATPESLRPGTVAPGEVWSPWKRPSEIPAPETSLLAPEWRSPLRRWRARLVASSLEAPAPIASIWTTTGDPAVLDDLADLVEARWRVGLARIWYANAALAARVIARLTRTLELAPGVAAPVWPADQSTLDSLLSDLLDPGLSGAALSARVEAWLRSMPRAAAWVRDDAGGSGRSVLATLGIALLDDEPLLEWTTGRDGDRVGDPRPLAPGGWSSLDLPLERGEPVTGGRAFTARCGDEPYRLAVRGVLSIQPPGASCGPLLRDWTLDAWATGSAEAGALPDAGRSGAAMIFRDDSGASPSGWSVFLECAGESPFDHDEVRVWLGARGRSLSVLRICGDGRFRDEATANEETLIGVSRGEERWSATVPIPHAAIEADGVVRVGLSRRDPRGVRTGWPRRLMPWEQEPSRAAVDLRTWSGM
ncbi:MAG: hypothetical protein IPJ41_06215 [Phycisphaerales bacterium]|nr:hypothetical protein [Phycisphaerales bacterium]